MYLWLKLLHILAAVIAVGSNITYFYWLSRIRRGGAASSDIITGIKAIDARVANPAYVVLPITGVVMVLDADLGFTTFWIAAAIILYIVMGVVAGILFSPSLRRQVALAEAGDTDSEAYSVAAKRTIVGGIATMVPIAVILYLMVLKPAP